LLEFILHWFKFLALLSHLNHEIAQHLVTFLIQWDFLVKPVLILLELAELVECRDVWD